MTLAAEYNAADIRKDAVRTRIEALLFDILPPWKHWEFHKPDGIEVWFGTQTPRVIAELYRNGFRELTLHNHRPERFLSCECKTVATAPRRVDPRTL